MAPHEQIRQTEKKFCSLALTIAVIAGFVLIVLGYKPVGKGLVLGALFSIFNFILMGATLNKRIGISRTRATVVSGISIFSRYLLLAIPLIAAIKMAQFNLFATIGGLFMIQILILADQLVHIYFPATTNKPDI